ncbi:MAG: hypothetical protein WD995_12385, partial [Gemmatimonadota bacterium]
MTYIKRLNRTTEGTGRAAKSLLAGALAAVVLVGCGDNGITDPVDVELGETTFVFLMNPVINDANEQSVPAPGSSVG